MGVKFTLIENLETRLAEITEGDAPLEDKFTACERLFKTTFPGDKGFYGREIGRGQLALTERWLAEYADHHPGSPPQQQDAAVLFRTALVRLSDQINQGHEANALGR